MNVVMTGVGPLRRGAGHGRGHAVQPRELDDLLGLAEAGIGEIVDAAGARCVAEPPPPRPSRRGRRLRVTAARRCATANPDKVGRDRGASSATAVELVPRPADVPDVVEDADTLEGNARLKAVALAAATGVPARGRRHRPRGRRARRRAGRALGPLRRRATRPTPTTWPSCSASWPVVPEPAERTARFRTRARSCAGPTAARWWPRARSTGTIAAAPRGRRRLRLRPGVRARRRRRAAPSPR